MPLDPPPPRTLRVLLIEDSEPDAGLILHEIRRHGYRVHHQRVSDAASLQEALAAHTWDLILADYCLPRFTGLQALELVKARGRDIPFIVVSGNIGEDVAVGAIKAGAHDYLLKDRLARLGTAIERELREAEARRSRRQTEEQLRKLSQAVEQGPAVVCITDPSGTIEYVNPRFTEVTGYTPPEVVGQSARLLKSGRCTLAEYEHLWNTISHGDTWRGSFLNRRRDGSQYWESATITPIRDNTGTITHYLKLAEDITGQKAAEQRIREQAELLDHASDAIHVRTLDHIIRYWNLAAGTIYGWQPGEVLGRKYTDIHPHDAQFVRAQAALLEHGGWSGEMKHPTQSGKVIDVFCRWTLVHGEPGHPASILAIHTDVTEKKQIESQYLRAQRLESLGSLAGGIAHDLNNILSPILLAVPLLREAVANPDDRRMLDTVASNARRGAEIVKQILTFARGVPGERLPVQPKYLIEQTLQMVHSTFPKQIRVTHRTPNDLWPMLADATQIQQVLMNLCINARDAMPRGGTLSIAATNVTLDHAYAARTPGAQPGPHVCVRVGDTGCGIPEEVLDSIFEPFFTTKPPHQGTGLGLSTVLGIVRSHGGFINVDTLPNRGSTFEVYLPARPSSTPVSPPNPEAPAPRGGNEHILVVDDEASLRDGLHRVLERHGYRVLTAADGAEAISLLSQHRASLHAVVSDLIMPGLHGPELVRAALQIAPDLPFIGMTGASERDGFQALKPLPLAALLTKPFPAERLLAALHQALHGAKGPPAPPHTPAPTPSPPATTSAAPIPAPQAPTPVPPPPDTDHKAVAPTTPAAPPPSTPA